MRTPTKLIIVRRNGQPPNSTNMKRVKVWCCNNRSTCPNMIKWVIDGQYYCLQHAEDFFNSHFVEDHTIIRIDRNFREEKPTIARSSSQMQMSC